jgi:hypothetical protein
VLQTGVEQFQPLKYIEGKGGIMKKILSIIVIVITMIAMSAPSFADTPGLADESVSYATVASETTYLSDGSYNVITVKESVSVSDNILKAAALTKSGSKTTSYYNSSGTLLWYVKVTGTFTYNGSTSSCTNATVLASAPDSAWVISSKSSNKSGNQATASATAKRYNGSILLQTVTKTVTLTCSKSGALS